MDLADWRALGGGSGLNSVAALATKFAVGGLPSAAFTAFSQAFLTLSGDKPNKGRSCASLLGCIVLPFGEWRLDKA